MSLLSCYLLIKLSCVATYFFQKALIPGEYLRIHFIVNRRLELNNYCNIEWSVL